jgi:hypothetical protein
VNGQQDGRRLTPVEALARMAELVDEDRLPEARRILAAVYPWLGVTLTPEEAVRAASWYYGQRSELKAESDRALAERLGEA